MKGMVVIASALLVTVIGLAMLAGCAETMGSSTGKTMTMEKDAAMGMEGSKITPAHAMMEETGSGMIEKTKTGDERVANLTGAVGHNASGTVALMRDTHASAVLTFTDLTVDRVPDGRVYLAKNGDYTHGVELGKLTQFSGTVAFSIPAGVRSEDYDSVVIWCKKFNVEIGHAFFEKKMMKMGDSPMTHEKTMMETEKGMMR